MTSMLELLPKNDPDRLALIELLKRLHNEELKLNGEKILKGLVIFVPTPDKRFLFYPE